MSGLCCCSIFNFVSRNFYLLCHVRLNLAEGLVWRVLGDRLSDISYRIIFISFCKHHHFFIFSSYDFLGFTYFSCSFSTCPWWSYPLARRPFSLHLPLSHELNSIDGFRGYQPFCLLANQPFCPPPNKYLILWMFFFKSFDWPTVWWEIFLTKDSEGNRNL